MRLNLNKKKVAEIYANKNYENGIKEYQYTYDIESNFNFLITAERRSPLPNPIPPENTTASKKNNELDKAYMGEGTLINSSFLIIVLLSKNN